MKLLKMNMIKMKDMKIKIRVKHMNAKKRKAGEYFDSGDVDKRILAAPLGHAMTPQGRLKEMVRKLC